MSPESRPEFATNGPGQRVADAINAHLAFLRGAMLHPPQLSIASAYVNAGGYAVLADELDRVGAVRLLLGAEPDAQRTVRPLKESPTPARAARA